MAFAGLAMRLVHLDRFRYPFEMVRTNALHYTYTADFSINIQAGSMTISCIGTLEMRGHPVE